MTGAVIDDSPRRFPSRVERAIERWHSAAVARSSGRVLDLSIPFDRLVLVGALGIEVEPSWDVIISAGELARFPDLGLAFRAIDRLLVPTGRLDAFEPVARPGTLRMFAAAPFTRTPWLRGMHVGRDLLAAMRTTALVGDDVERVTMRTLIVPLRHFVSLSARRAIPSSEAD